MEKENGSPSRNIWIKSINIRYYRGIICAKTLLTCISGKNALNYPNISDIIKTYFYVDDFLTGSDSFMEAADKGRDIKIIFERGGFELRKFYSNESAVLCYIDRSLSKLNLINCSDCENAKTLGIFWKFTLYKFTYGITEEIPSSTSITKRTILSNITQIFDLLGILAPCMI